MPLSRRAFLARLGGACAVSRLAVTSGPRGCEAGTDSISNVAPADSHPVLLDLGQQCVLRESFQGFRRALEASGTSLRVLPLAAIPAPSRLVIVPGATLRDREFAVQLCASVSRGASLLYESAAAYAPSEDFEAERRLLGRHFRVTIGEPVDVWPGLQNSPTSRRLYVEYCWPVKAHIRDFSRIIPAAATEFPPIASLAQTPVACRKRLGRGQFIFLGSPLGPHLLAGDWAAHDWLQKLVARLLA